MFLADAKQSQDSSLHPSVKVSHKHLIRTVLRQVSCLHLAIVPKGFISFDQIERSSDLPFWCGSVHTSAPACFLSGVLVCPVCVCVRYPVSVLPPVWFVLARTCPGPHLDAGKPIATWAPTYPTFHSTLPFFFYLAFSTRRPSPLDTTDFDISRYPRFPIDILLPTFRCHGLGYVLGQRHAAGATSSSAARRLAGSRSART